MASKVMIFTLGKELKESVEDKARKCNVSQGAICRLALSNYLGEKSNDCA